MDKQRKPMTSVTAMSQSRTRGAGMIEYFIIVIMITLGTVAAVRRFGVVARAQTGNMAMELSGQTGDLNTVDPGDGDVGGGFGGGGSGDTGGVIGGGGGDVSGGGLGGGDTGGGFVSGGGGGSSGGGSGGSGSGSGGGGGSSGGDDGGPVCTGD